MILIIRYLLLPPFYRKGIYNDGHLVTVKFGFMLLPPFYRKGIYNIFDDFSRRIAF